MKAQLCAAVAALFAGMAPAAEVRISSPANVKFAACELAIRPHVFLPGWKMIGATGGRTEEEGSYPYSFRLNDGAVARGRGSFAQLPGGRVSARWFLTVDKAQKVEQLYVGADLPPEVEGGAYVIDGRREKFPKPGERFQFGHRGNARTLAVEDAAGRLLCKFDFERPQRIMFQNNGGGFEVRFIDPAGELKPGEIYTCGFVLSGAEELKVVEPRPIVLAAGKDWVPLKAKVHVRPGSALDFGGIGGIDGPAGKYGRVVAKGGSFEFEGRPGVPLRFYGVNFCFGANYYHTPEQCEAFAANLARLGYNAVRIHHHDGTLVKRGGDATELDPSRLRELDAFVAAFYRHGIYVTTDLFVSRGVPYRAVGVDRPGNVEMGEFKMMVRTNELAFANLCTFAANWFSHVNEFTHRRWADEPGLAWVHLVNENCPDQFTKVTDANRAAQIEDEDRFYARMTAFMREKVGAKQLFSDLNGWSTSTEWTPCREKFDYVDMHFYVDHPRFLGQGWRLPSECSNVLPFSGTDTVHGVSWAGRCALKSKPFTITEWNFSAPGNYRGLGGIATGAIAAREGWDGLWRFAWSHAKEGVDDPESCRMDYFNMAGDPLALASERATMCLFLRGDLKPGDARALRFDAKKGTMLLETERTCGGFAQRGAFAAGCLSADVGASRATVWASSVDGAPLATSRRILVTHLTDVQNSGVKFADDSMKVLLDWGRLPHLMRVGRAEVVLKVDPGDFAAYALEADGTRRAEIPCSCRDGRLAFVADVARDPANATYLYEVVRK